MVQHTHDHFSGKRQGNKKGLIIALSITAGIMILEFFGGLFTNSLALLSDSGHMLSDTGSLALSLLAIWFAGRTPPASKTFGFYRTEILAALFNGTTLFVISAFIVKEAIGRFTEPPSVAGGPMMVIAVIGLIANFASAYALHKTSDVKENVNLRSAYVHVIGDALGSVGAIIAGLLMLWFGWYIADPIISMLVALLILKSAWGVLKNSVDILMESAPQKIEKEKIISGLEQLEGVTEAHDLHVWTITSGLDMFTCHLTVEDEADEQDILQQALRLLHDEFHLEHVTIQIEKSSITHADPQI